MDNIYAEGTIICSKAHPDRKLVINRYLKRIYYCKAVDDPTGKLFAFFENELLPPQQRSI
jgi:hypothetical protein